MDHVESPPPPPGTGHETRIVLDATKLAQLDSAPDAFSPVIVGSHPDQGDGSDVDSDLSAAGSGDDADAEDAASSSALSTRRVAPEPDFIRLHAPSKRYASSEDDSDLDERLPLMVHDDQSLRQRRQARTKAKEEEENRQRHYKLRQRRKYEQWKRWEDRLRDLAKRWLPAWFTAEMSIEAGAGLGKWSGIDRLGVLWYTSHRAVKITAISVVAFCVLWWFVLPLLFGGGWGAPRPADPNAAAGGKGGPWGTRIDGNGIEMARPLPLCDLLYERGAYAKRSDQLSTQLTKKAAGRIREWWKTSGPPLSKELQQQQQHQQHQQQQQVQAEGPTTRVPDHHQSLVWDRLVETGAVRFPLDHKRFLEQAQPAALSLSDIHTMEQARDAFVRSTREWLTERCRAADAAVSAVDFAAAAASEGHTPVDVVGYMSGPPIQPKKMTGRELVKEMNQLHHAQEQHELEKLLRIEDDGPGTKPPPPPQIPSAERLLPPPPPTELLRNVSIYELHVLLGYLASQAQGASVTRATASELEAQLGNRVASASTTFDPAATTATGDAEELPQGGRGPDPWSSLVRDQLAKLDRERDADLTALRGAVLWSGVSGCTCAHHVGIPIPAASWYEPPQPPHMSEGRVRVLFYPQSDAVAAHQATTSSGDSGSVGWQALRWLVGAESAGNAALSSPPTEHASLREVWWDATDPVLLMLSGAEPIEDADEKAPQLLRLPPSAMAAPWTWVEGIDFRGNKRRHRISPRSLACILSCTHACGGGGKKL